MLMADGNNISTFFYLPIPEVCPPGIIRVGNDFYSRVRGDEKRSVSQPLNLHGKPPLYLLSQSKDYVYKCPYSITGGSLHPVATVFFTQVGARNVQVHPGC